MTIESAILILTFIFPGSFSKVLLSKFTNLENKKDGYIELCEYISVSFAVLLLNFLIIRILNFLNFTGFKITSKTIINEIFKINFTVGFVIKYFILTILSTIIITLLLWVFLKNVFPKITSINGTRNIYGYTLWESIFHEEDEEIGFKLNQHPLVEVFKDGELLQVGLLESMNGNPNKDPEFLLCYSDEMKGYLENDKGLNEEEKIFSEYKSYCNIKEKIVIKVYKMDKYHQYVGSFNQQSIE